MACYYPLHGYKSKHANKSGKRSIVFNKDYGYKDLPVVLPCGRCHGCRLEKSRQWALRCLHESKLYPENSFITLTYDDKNLPSDGSLIPEHHQQFMKALRHHLTFTCPETGEKIRKKIRYYHCGEYGDQSGRPHYHTLLFNHDFPDKEIYSEIQGTPLYTSPTLEKIWGKGFCTIGEVNFETAAYVARYVMKKINGDKADEHYQSLDPITGVINKIEPEYTTMSRRPGIGSDWYKKYKTEVYPSDFVVVNGKKMKPPRFYDSILEREDKKLFEEIHQKRGEHAHENREHEKYERLVAREKVSKARTNLKARKL